jgi:hypothetical protein
MTGGGRRFIVSRQGRRDGVPFPGIATDVVGGGKIALPAVSERLLRRDLFNRGSWCPYCNLASELGPFSVRVVNIRSGGSYDSRVFSDAIEQGGDEVEIALAARITGVTVDVTCGTTSALNYKVPVIAFLDPERHGAGSRRQV